MGFTTLVNYSRQLTQHQGTNAEFSGNTTILGGLTLGSIYPNSVAYEGYPYYSYLYMSGGTNSPYTRYSPVTKTWQINMPDPADSTVTYMVNRLKINLNDDGQNGQFGVFAQQSVFSHKSSSWNGVENSGYHQPATVMIIGSGTTNATKAFTVTSSVTNQGIGKVGLSVDDELNIRLGENSTTGTSQVFLHGAVVLGSETVATGALSPTIPTTFITIDGTKAYTLANGVTAGTIKHLSIKTAINTPAGTLTPTATAGVWVTASFSVVGQTLTILWDGAGWSIVGRGSGDAAATGVVSGLPVIAI